MSEIELETAKIHKEIKAKEEEIEYREEKWCFEMNKKYSDLNK